MCLCNNALYSNFVETLFHIILFWFHLDIPLYFNIQNLCDAHKTVRLTKNIVLCCLTSEHCRAIHLHSKESNSSTMGAFFDSFWCAWKYDSVPGNDFIFIFDSYSKLGKDLWPHSTKHLNSSYQLDSPNDQSVLWDSEVPILFLHMFELKAALQARFRELIRSHEQVLSDGRRTADWT